MAGSKGKDEMTWKFISEPKLPTREDIVRGSAFWNKKEHLAFTALLGSENSQARRRYMERISFCRLAAYLAQKEGTDEMTIEPASEVRARLESAVVALVAEFMGAVTGMRPPMERRLFPEHMEVPLQRLCDGLIQVVQEHEANRLR